MLHVERVIGNIRQKYSILSCTQPIDFVNSNDQVTTLDKIVCATCALVNMHLINYQLSLYKLNFCCKTIVINC